MATTPPRPVSGSTSLAAEVTRSSRASLDAFQHLSGLQQCLERVCTENKALRLELGKKTAENQAMQRRIRELEAKLNSVAQMLVLPEKGRINDAKLTSSPHDQPPLPVADVVSKTAAQESKDEKGGDAEEGDVKGTHENGMISTSRGRKCQHGLIIKGHKGDVHCMCMVNDHLLATGAWDNTVRVWNAQTRELVLQLQGHEGHVSGLCRVGDFIASCSWDKTTRIWNLSTGECEKVLEGHTSWVWCMVAVNNVTVATGSCDNSIRIYNLNTGLCKHTLRGHRAPVVDLAVCGNDLLASCSRDRSVILWSPSNGEMVSTCKLHGNFVSSIANLGRGLLISGSWDQKVRIIDTANGECLRKLAGHTDNIFCVIRVGKDLIASAGKDSEIRLWSVTSGRCVRTLVGHTDSVWKICRITDDIIASCSRDHTVRVWSVGTGECVMKIRDHHASVLSLVSLGNGIIASGAADGTVGFWKVSQEEIYRLSQSDSGAGANEEDALVVRSPSSDWDAAHVLPPTPRTASTVKMTKRDNGSLALSPRTRVYWHAERSITSPKLSLRPRKLLTSQHVQQRHHNHQPQTRLFSKTSSSDDFVEQPVAELVRSFHNSMRSSGQRVGWSRTKRKGGGINNSAWR